MSRYSCTNERYEFTPVRLEIIGTLQRGTLLIGPRNQEPTSGDPYVFTDRTDIFDDGEAYIIEEDLPYVEGFPEENPFSSGLCWECQSSEEVCFDESFEEVFPHPCVWYVAPYFYFCQQGLSHLVKADEDYE
jgi:hypothetical protein